MVAIAREPDPASCASRESRESCYQQWLATTHSDRLLVRAREHHEQCIRIIDKRLGELRPSCWRRRQWSDAALSCVFATLFAAWLLLISWAGQLVWSWLVD